MLDNAIDKGAIARTDTQVLDVLFDGDTAVGVRAKMGPDRTVVEIASRIVVDATGQSAFLANRLGLKDSDPRLKKATIWGYFKGARRDAGKDEGATIILQTEGKRSWFWYIPLSGDMVSVGIVAEHDYLFDGSTKDLAEIFNREVKNNLWIEEHLSQGEQEGEYRVTGEFSYRNKFCAIDGLVLAGDALGFLDPVFSSGVFLALKSGVMLADAADLALKKGDVSAATFEQYGKSMQDSIETMRKIVYAFYDEGFSFKDLVMKGDDMRSDLTDCLVGNVDENDFSSLFAAMSKLAELPEPIEHGLAKVGP